MSEATVPRGVREGLLVQTGSDGSIKVSMINGARIVGSLNLAGKLTAALACNMLGAAKAAHDATGQTLPDATSTDSSWPIIVPSTAGLSACPEPGRYAVMFSFGEAKFGVSLGANVLRELGSAMLTLAATGSKQ